MGTITKYYPFIDEETKSILGTLMDESHSYYDFVLRLCEIVINNDVPLNLAYIAAVQAWWGRTQENLELIQERYKDVICIRPWGYPHTSSLSDQVRYHDIIVDTIEKVIATAPDDWIETELHLLHAYFHCPFHGDVPSLLEPIERAKDLIKDNPDLNCFDSLICSLEGWGKDREGDMKGAIPDYQRGLELAEDNDDSLYKYSNLINWASTLRTFNIKESLEVYEKLYVFVQDLEVPYFIAEVLNDSALAFETAGEYDLAISSIHETIKIMGDGDTPCLILARIYSMLGEGQKALEWANRSFEYAIDLEFSVLYLRKAFALAVSNRLEEATENLDIAYPLIMKTGSEIWLGNYYHISGIIELRREDFPAALDLLEKAWDIAERNSRGINQNRVILDLARVEIALADQSVDSTKDITPGKWLSKLEKYAVERDLPGIRMYAAL